MTVALSYPTFTTDGTSRYSWHIIIFLYSKFSLTKVAASEGSAYHFKCNKGYKRYGVRNTHCDGQSWSHGDNTPVCTSRSNSFIPSQLLSSCLIVKIALGVLF